MKEEFILIEDDDGHWYVIPSDKEKEFNLWLGFSANPNNLDEEWTGYDFESQGIGGSPSLVKFKNYRIE